MYFCTSLFRYYQESASLAEGLPDAVQRVSPTGDAGNRTRNFRCRLSLGHDRWWSEGDNAANKLTAECPAPRTVVLGTAVPMLLGVLVLPGLPDSPVWE